MEGLLKEVQQLIDKVKAQGWMKVDQLRTQNVIQLTANLIDKLYTFLQRRS